MPPRVLRRAPGAPLLSVALLWPLALGCAPGVVAPDADATPADAPAPDALTPDALAPDAPAPTLLPPLYPADRTLSPLTPAVAASVRAVVARSAAPDARVFAKVGASNTVNTNFAQCFAGTHVDLAGRDALAPALAHFLAGRAGTTTPFDRTSLAATIGWSAWSALAGDPSPLTQELDAINPRYALVMYGTNDVQSRDIFRYAQNLLDIADQLAARGVVPIYTSVPPRDDDPAADLWVPRYNAVSRGVAQARRFPFIDLERELRLLPGHGLGPDGIHLNALVQGGAARACVLTPEGLGYGFNLRNLLTLETLARTLAVVQGAPAPDATAPTLAGSGTSAEPYAVAALPFADLRDTARGGQRVLARYTGCRAAQDESGPEFVYRYEVTRPTRVRAMVFVRGAVDVDLHLLDATGTAAGCVARDDRALVADLAPGVHHFALDTFVDAAGTAHPGEYLFVLVPEP